MSEYNVSCAKQPRSSKLPQVRPVATTCGNFRLQGSMYTKYGIVFLRH